MNVAHHIPILCKRTPEWQTLSVGFHYKRSSQKDETHRVLPAVDEEPRGRQKETQRGESSFGTADPICSIVSTAGDNIFACIFNWCHRHFQYKKPRNKGHEHISLNFKSHRNKTRLTSVTMKRPMRKDTTEMTNRSSLRRWPLKK